MTAYTSSQDGDWDQSSTWGGAGVPTTGDTAAMGHTVTANTGGGITVDSITLNSGGELIIDTDMTVGTNTSATTDAITVNNGGGVSWSTSPSGDHTLLLTGRINIQAGGKFYVGTSANRIPAANTATIEFGGSWEFQNIVHGEFRLYGAENYHMASKASQRGQLVVDVTAGSDRQFKVDTDVDWSVGDVVWVGTNGDPDETSTTCEKVTIKTKVNASTYTADFTYNHYGDGTYGDIVVHSDRNVIVKGAGSTQGFSFYTELTKDWVINISWARFEYAGRGAALGASAINLYMTDNYRMPKDSLIVQSTVFDEPGDALSTSALYFYNYVVLEEDPDHVNLDEIHVWNFGYGVRFGNVSGRYFFGHLTCMETAYGVYTRQYSFCIIDSLWYSNSDTGSGNTAITPNPATVRNFKVHGCYYAFDYDTGDSLLSTEIVELTNGEIFHAGNYAARFIEGQRSPLILVRDVDIRTARYAGVYMQDAGYNVMFVNCTFNKCGGIGSYGAVLLNQTAYPLGEVSFLNCEFGIDAQNMYYNINASQFQRQHRGRILIDHCKFREPASFLSPSYDWVNEHLLWACAFNNLDDWQSRVEQQNEFSFELVACEIRNAAGTDQWSTDYPNTDRLGIIPGGGEIHKTDPTAESSGYIDGTFQRKILPFMATLRFAATRTVPVKIPASAGDQVTVKLSLNKNVSQVAENRPKIHVEGCGVYGETTMGDTVGSFEQVSVTVTALSSGVLRFWISCKGVQDFHDADSPPTRAPVADYTWAYPYDPGDSSNLILYCDGLVVERV